MVRQATYEDLKQIVEIHEQCFPNSFSTKLGHLEAFYSTYMERSPELFLVGVNDNRIEGFCMGYYLENTGFMSTFLKQNFLPLALQMGKLLVSGEKAAWLKFKKILKKSESFQIIDEKYKNIPEQEIGDLLSICVVPDVRGKGLASELMLNYISTLKEKGRKVCFLTVDVNNERAIHFYQKHCFEPYKEIPNQCRTYARYI